MNKKRILKGSVIGLLSILLIVSLGFSFWIADMLYVVGNNPGNTPETLPNILENINSIEDWENQKPLLLKEFEEQIYGEIPTKEIAWAITETVIDESMYNGLATLREIRMVDPTNKTELGIVLITPNDITNANLLVVSSFCANHNAWPEYDSIMIPDYYPQFCENDGPLSSVMTPFFGEYIGSFPDEEILTRGYAIASYYLGDVVPDSKEYSKVHLEKISKLTEKNVTGAVAAWAWGYKEVARTIGSLDYVNNDNTVLYGHSRNGKASLIAAAIDPTIAGVISHQSGTAGSTLTRSHHGESIDAIMKDYGYWFSENYLSFSGKEDTLTIDQHQLVAMVAPRPALYTGARLDKWSDPKGTLLSVQEASKIYELYGAQGSSAQKLTDFYPNEDISFFMRGQSHGVQDTDWQAFLEFLDAHFVE